MSFALNSDLFITLFSSVLIGQSNYFRLFLVLVLKHSTENHFEISISVSMTFGFQSAVANKADNSTFKTDRIGRRFGETLQMEFLSSTISKHFQTTLAKA